MTGDQSRRAFLKRSAALSVAGAATPFVTNLACIGEAAAAVATDYKALVCVFLYGGNDYANTVTPYDQASYTQYQTLRPAIAYQRAALDATVLNPTVAPGAGLQFALAPALAPLLPIFDGGKLAVMLNTGTLIQPTTKAQYQARSVPLPPKLFSHNDQQSFFQTAAQAEGARSGWGGRMGDLLQSGNGNSTLTCINASGNAVFMTGQTAIQYSVSSSGPIALNNNANNLYGSQTANSVLRSMIAAPRTHLFENEHTRVTKRSLDAYTQVTTALAAAPTFATPSPNESLANQLRLVARMISVSQELGAKRQVFFVSLGGFDNHDSLNANHPALLARVAAAMRSFYDTTVEMGVADRVTTFTGSDFGRTLVNNTDGSDHGWGSVHFVMGGAVRGKRFYGEAPALANNGPNDVGQGRLLPTTSVDQYAATLAAWFGISASQMPTVLPSIGNFSNQNLGFI